MKVILLQDVAKIGLRFSITNVSDGYALNKLIPQKLAEPATTENIKRVQERASKIEAGNAQNKSDFIEALTKLSDKTITVQVDANEEGRLFSALKVADILSAIQNEVGVLFEESQIVIKTPIKEIGDNSISLVLGDTQETVLLKLVAK